MGTYQKNSVIYETLPKSVVRQACVRAIFRARFSREIEKEAEKFISRNILADCGKVPSCCLKYHLIRIAKKFRISKSKIASIKNIFKSELGHNNYYLDAGELKKA